MTQVRIYRERDGVTDILVLPGRAAQLAPVMLRHLYTEDGKAHRKTELVALLRQIDGDAVATSPG